MQQVDPITKACDFLKVRAFPLYIKDKCGKCAMVVREAFEFGFDKRITKVNSAKNYGKSYEELGFKKIFCSSENPENKVYTPKIGDISIIDYEPHGHICVYTSKGWISDFIQRDMYGGKIREKNPKFSIYRYEKDC